MKPTGIGTQLNSEPLFIMHPSLQHLIFPNGHPSRCWSGLMLLLVFQCNVAVSSVYVGVRLGILKLDIFFYIGLFLVSLCKYLTNIPNDQTSWSGWQLFSTAHRISTHSLKNKKSSFHLNCLLTGWQSQV